MSDRAELTATEKERPFSWSLRRRKLFDRCKKEYFLHYYGSTGGYEVGAADPEREFLHHLKRMLSGSEWLSRLLTLEVREHFYTLALLEPKTFRSAVLRRFEREFQAMMGGAAEHDHKHSFLMELLLPKCSCLKLHDELKEELERRLEVWNTELIPALGGIPQEQRRHIASPLGVPVGNLLCYAVPSAAFTAGSLLCIVEAGAPAPETALLHKMYAFNIWHRAPERVKSLSISQEGRCREFGSDLNVSDALRSIRADVQAMLELRHEDGSWHENDFPCSREQCGQCRFRAWCQT